MPPVARKRYVVLTEWGYRGLVEEQYVNIGWMAESHLRMGVELTLILRGYAVLHAAQAADHQGRIEVGARRLENVCDARRSLREAIQAGVQVLVDAGDWRRVAPQGSALGPGVEAASAERIAALVDAADAAWYW
jgi:hypothetical protein